MPKIDEETMILAQLAATTSTGINSNIIRDKDYHQLAARLNHRDIILGQQANGMDKITRGHVLQQHRAGIPNPNVGYQGQQYPTQQMNIPPQMGGAMNVVSEPLIKTDINGFPLPPSSAKLIPPVAPTNNEGYQPNYNEPISPSGNFNDFQIPDYGGNRQTNPIGETKILQQQQNDSFVILLQHMSGKIDELLKENESLVKKINRMEKKINEIVKHLTPKEQND